MKKKKVSVKSKIRANPWILSTLVFGVLCIVLIGSSFTMTGKVISSEKAGNNFVDFINSMGEANIEYVSSGDFGHGLYEIVVSAEGQEVPVQLTKDGMYWIQSLVPIMDKVDVEQAQKKVEEEVSSEAYTGEDLVKLNEFSTCLADNGIKIYGANWCGWTKKLVVDTLGGFDNVGEVYVECTEETELCSQEGIAGYPTIKHNGQAYQGQRTLEALGEATGCVVPELTGNGASTSSSSAGAC